jgi:hypothetical protein
MVDIPFCVYMTFKVIRYVSVKHITYLYFNTATCLLAMVAYLLTYSMEQSPS